MSKLTELPALFEGDTERLREERASLAAREVWVRLGAFLRVKAPGTQETYLGILREWCEFLGVRFGTAEAAARILSIDELAVAAYRSWLDKRPGEKPRSGAAPSAERAVAAGRARAKKNTGLEATLSNATIAKKFAALRRMYRVLVSAGLGIPTNPFDSDLTPSPSKEAGRKRPTEMVDFETVMELVHAPQPSTPRGVRDRAILALMFGAALRRSEVIELRVGDVRRSVRGTPFLYLRATKAKRDAEQPVPEWAIEILDAWIDLRRQSNPGESDYLFVSGRGRGGATLTTEPLTASGLYKLFLHYAKLIGIENTVTPHSARATAITKLLDDGVPHREVKDFSRHSSIQMVEVYDKRRITVDQNAGNSLTFARSGASGRGKRS